MAGKNSKTPKAAPPIDAPAPDPTMAAPEAPSEPDTFDELDENAEPDFEAEHKEENE